MRRPILVATMLAILLAAAPRAESRSTVPTPESVFGFTPGADDKFATYDQSIA